MHSLYRKVALLHRLLPSLIDSCTVPSLFSLITLLFHSAVLLCPDISATSWRPSSYIFSVFFNFLLFSSPCYSPLFSQLFSSHLSTILLSSLTFSFFPHFFSSRHRRITIDEERLVLAFETLDVESKGERVEHSILVWHILFRAVLAYSILFRAVLACSILFCAVLVYSILFRAVLASSIMFCSVLSWPILSCSVLCCSSLFCHVLFCAVLVYSIMFCAVLQSFTSCNHAFYYSALVAVHVEGLLCFDFTSLHFSSPSIYSNIL